MMHTDKEAGELWCPMVRIARNEVVERERVVHVGGGLHRVDPEERTVIAGCNTDALGGLRVPHSCRCIGSKCAMWRSPVEGKPLYKTIVCPDAYATIEPPRPAVVPPSWEFCSHDNNDGEPACWIEDDESRNSRFLGYCGLAGKP